MPIAGRAELIPYPQDAALIKEYRNEAPSHSGRRNATALRSFSDYLRQNNKKGIAGRLTDEALDGDVKAYRKDASGNGCISAALAHLRESHAGAKAIERERHIPPVPDPEDATRIEPRRIGEAIAQHSASHEAGSWPKELAAKAHDQDVRLGLMDAAGPPSSLEPAARHDQAPDPGVSNHQRSPDELMGAPAWSNLLPSEEVLIEDELDTAELRPAKRQRTLDDPQGLAAERQLSEIANSGGRLLTPAGTHQLGASPWEARPMMQGSGYEDAAAPHAIAMSVGDAAAQQGPVSWPSVGAEGYDQDLMVEDGPPWSGVPPEQAQDIVQAGWQEAARSTSAWSVQMPLNFDWSMWPASEPAPVHFVRARSDAYGDFEAAVNPNPPRPVPGHHQGARQTGSPLALSPLPASSDDEALAWLSEELERRQMLRDTEWQQMMQATGSAAILRSGGPDDVQLIHRGRLSPMSEAAPTPQAASPETARLPETYRGLPVVDVATLTTSSSDAQIRAFDPTASSKVAKGSVLGADEWLSDAHILRDYQFLTQALQRIDPTLAGRTQLVDPLIANGSLRFHSFREIDRLSALQRILSDRDGNDTADFLFLPVSNATEHSSGTHWSLLLVDRRNRESPVAYHYDSLQRKGHNDVPANQLAGLLNATLAPARMP